MKNVHEFYSPVVLFRAIRSSICEAAKMSRFPDPKLLPATMQELSIKKMLANDMKKSVKNDSDFPSKSFTVCFLIEC